MITNISENELLDYKGMGSIPDDFDEYWQRAILEMENTEPNLEMKRVNVNLHGQECFDIYFTGVRNARIHCRYIRPKNAKKYPLYLKHMDMVIKWKVGLISCRLYHKAFAL